MMKLLRNILILAAMGTALSACNMPDPCVTLGPPSAVEIEAAKGGAEVEREVNNTECVVVGDRYVNGASVED